MNKTLFIRGLAWAITTEDLKSIFSDIEIDGTKISCTNAKVLWDRERNRSKGCGFVDFDTPELAAKVKEKFDGAELGGRKVGIDFARERTEGERAPRREQSNSY